MTDTIATIMIELKQRRDWNNPQEVEIWFEKKLREVEAQAVAEEMAKVRENLPKVIMPTVEPPPNNLSQNQIFASGQINMLLRVYDVLDYLDKPVTKKE